MSQEEILRVIEEHPWIRQSELKTHLGARPDNDMIIALQKKGLVQRRLGKGRKFILRAINQKPKGG
jgi:hypothetical protein